jgi:plasmid stabilization system protein ParE
VTQTYALSAEAEQDLQEIRAYYLQKVGAGARVALHVGRRIIAAFEFLAATPGAGHTRADLTSEPVKFWQVFSYLIVYDPAMRPLGIARVLHSRRDLKSLFRETPPRA